MSKSWSSKNNRNNQYENVIITQQHSTPKSSSSSCSHQDLRTRHDYENYEVGFEVGSPYENVVLGQSSSPRTKIKTYIPHNKQTSTPKEQNEIAVPPENHDLPETPKRKLSPQKFILPIDLDTSPEVKTTKDPKPADRSRFEKLKTEKGEIMSMMVSLKRKISDIEIQEEELLREVSYFQL